MNKHFIITNREIIATPKNKRVYQQVNEEEYIRTDGRELATESLRFGTYEFKDENDEGEITILPEADLDEFKADDDNDVNLPSNSFFKEMYGDIKNEKAEQGEILVYIHGFKADLETALQTVRKLHTKYVESDDSPIRKIVLFTWPAMDKIFKYRNDARDARASGYAFARAIGKVQKFLTDHVLKQEDCKQRIHLMAHSMGNQVLEAMIEEIRDENSKIHNLFSDTFLVGADVDYDAFENPRPLNYLIDYTERIHIFHHKGDKALGVSETTKNAFNRLGRWGAKNSRLLPDSVYQYNVSDIDDDDGLINEVVHHWYYYNSDEVVDMISNILSDFKSD